MKHEGLVVLAGDGSVEVATPEACALFDCATTAELRSRWETCAGAVGASIAGGAPPAGEIALHVSTANGTRRLRVRLERFEPSDRDGYAAVIGDAETSEPTMSDLRLATYHRALGRLSPAVAHDLKAPLAAVLLHLELLRGTLTDDASEADPSLRERQLRYVGIMKDELGRLNRSLASLFSHITLRGDTEDDVDVCELLHELEFLIRPHARKQGVALALAFGDAPARIRGRREALKHGVLNVALNALEAMPAGGRLHIELEAKEEFVTITIRDTGAGVSADIASAMFDARRTTKRMASGLGLAVAKSVLDEQGGRIRFESSADGTCFHLDLAKGAIA